MKHRANIHGGNIYRAQEQYGIGRDQVLDYSANINPLGVPQSLQAAITDNMNILTCYPDPDYIKARTNLAHYHGVDISNIIMGNGATEIIFLLMETLKPRKVLIPCPSFSEYEQAAVDAGCEVEHYRIKEEQDYILDPDGLIESIDQDVEMLILCNPNNPTGQIIRRDSMKTILNACRERGIVVVIDEAFVDFVDEEQSVSMVDQLEGYLNLFIIKALTKFFAVPGLRLGYGLGSERLIKRISLKKQPWSLNNFASLAAEILPNDSEYIRETKEWLKTERKRFYNCLGLIEGIKIFEPFGNFILIKLLNPHVTSSMICDRMVRKGILVRNAENFIFLDKQYIRIAIKDQKANDIFIEKFKQTLKEVEVAGGIHT